MFILFHNFRHFAFELQVRGFLNLFARKIIAQNCGSHLHAQSFIVSVSHSDTLSIQLQAVVCFVSSFCLSDATSFNLHVSFPLTGTFKYDLIYARGCHSLLNEIQLACNRLTSTNAIQRYICAAWFLVVLAATVSHTEHTEKSVQKKRERGNKYVLVYFG